jgi:hypothetical protein
MAAAAAMAPERKARGGAQWLESIESGSMN